MRFYGHKHVPYWYGTVRSRRDWTRNKYGRVEKKRQYGTVPVTYRYGTVRSKLTKWYFDQYRPVLYGTVIYSTISKTEVKIWKRSKEYCTVRYRYDEIPKINNTPIKHRWEWNKYIVSKSVLFVHNWILLVKVNILVRYRTVQEHTILNIRFFSWYHTYM